MKPVLSLGRWATGVVLAAVVTLAAASSAAASSPVWGPPVPYASPGALLTIFTSVSCASDQNCVAFGESISLGGDGAAVAAESDGTWGPAVKLPGGSGIPTTLVVSGSVSCASATSCVVASTIENAEKGTSSTIVPIAVSGSTVTPGAASVVALPAGAKTGSEERATLAGVSCASVSECTVVGSYLDAAGTAPMVVTRGADGVWRGAEVTPPGAAGSDFAKLTSISCPSSGPCEAVGNYAGGSEEDVLPWAVQVSGGAAATGETVEMPSNFKPNPPSEDGASVLAALGITAEGLDSVSCPSAGVCTAAGSYTTSEAGSTTTPVAVPITNGTPGTAVDLSQSSTGKGFIDGISCSDATDCNVAGFTEAPLPGSVVGSETGGTWSSLAPLPSGSGSGGFDFPLITSMSCAGAGRCVATGLEFNEAAIASGSVPAFFAYSAPPLSVSTSSLPGATVGVPYSATLQAAGGAGSQKWSISAGSLPAGLSLNAETGVVSGTPTASGQDGFAVNAEETEPSQTASANLTIAVAAAAPPTPVVGLVLAKTSGETATVVLSCSGAPCAGKLTIAGVEHLEGKTATAAAVAAKATKKKKAKATTKKITLASRSYSVAVGGTQVVTLKLSKTANRLLAQLHKLSGELDVTPAGASKAAIVHKLTFTSKAKSKKKTKKKPATKKKSETKKKPATKKKK